MLLEDKNENNFYNLCDSACVKTKLEAGTTNGKYRIHLVKAKAIYNLHQDYSGVYLWEDNERILLYGDGVHELQEIRVWNKEHELIEEKEYNGGIIVFDDNIRSGRYSVDLKIEGQWIEHYPIEVK